MHKTFKPFSEKTDSQKCIKTQALLRENRQASAPFFCSTHLQGHVECVKELITVEQVRTANLSHLSPTLCQWATPHPTRPLWKTSFKCTVCVRAVIWHPEEELISSPIYFVFARCCWLTSCLSCKKKIGNFCNFRIFIHCCLNRPHVFARCCWLTFCLSCTKKIGNCCIFWHVLSFFSSGHVFSCGHRKIIFEIWNLSEKNESEFWRTHSKIFEWTDWCSQSQMVSQTFSFSSNHSKSDLNLCKFFQLSWNDPTWGRHVFAKLTWSFQIQRKIASVWSCIMWMTSSRV